MSSPADKTATRALPGSLDGRRGDCPGDERFPCRNSEDTPERASRGGSPAITCPFNDAHRFTTSNKWSDQEEFSDSRKRASRLPPPASAHRPVPRTGRGISPGSGADLIPGADEGPRALPRQEVRPGNPAPELADNQRCPRSSDSPGRHQHSPPSLWRHLRPSELLPQN